MSTGPEPSSLPYADRYTPRPHEHGTSVTRRDVAALAVKLMGLYLIVQAIPAVVAIVGWMMDGAPHGGAGYYLSTFGLSAGLGLVLLAVGDRIGAWLMADPSPLPSEPAPPDVRNVQSAAFAVAGVMLIAVWALPGLVYDGWRFFYALNPVDAQQRAIEGRPYLARHVVELLLGLFLFYGSKRLSAYWHRLRTHRLSHADDDEGPL